MTIASRENESCYPPPESVGGWRWIEDPDQVSDLAGMDLGKLDLVFQSQEFHYGGDQWSIVIVRHGYMVREFHTFNIPIPTRFNIWSGTKSFTGTAWGLLLEASRRNELPNGQHVDLDTPAYPFIPEGYPLTDPRKDIITFRRLLTMTFGIAGHPSGCIGTNVTAATGLLRPQRAASAQDRCWKYLLPDTDTKGHNSGS